MSFAELLCGVATPVGIVEPQAGRMLIRAASSEFRCLTGTAGVAEPDLLHCTLRFEPDTLQRAMDAALGTLPPDAPSYAVPQGDFVAWSAGGVPHRVTVRRAAASGSEGPSFCLTAERYGIAASGGPRDQYFFGQMVESSPDIIAVIDRQYRHVYVNQAITEASGSPPEAFVGRDHYELGMPPEMAAYFQSVYREVFETGREGSKEFVFPAPDGTLRSYNSRVVPLPEESGETRVLLSYARDITERRAAEAARLELERKLQETQRLESLGLLAGGIAHDFNNILTSILGMASLARQKATDATCASALQQIERASLKAAELCNQMLAYAGRGQTLKVQLDLAGLLHETRELLHGSVPKQVELRVSTKDAPLMAYVDRPQLQQVLMNLVLNAVESYGDAPGDVHVAVTRAPYVAAEWAAAVVAPDTTEGASLVCVEVRDHGPGMDSETLAHVFEPFFTTKFAGRGLGLAATLGIVRGHGGGLCVTSTPGTGTTFRLALCESSVRHDAGVSAAAAAPAPVTGHVLIVDDEPAVRDATQLMVEALGYRVTSAPDGETALGHLSAPNAGYDLALLDLTMPRMDGFELLRRIRLQQPALPVVLMSGYVESDIRERAEAGADVASVDFLQKPFVLEGLRSALAKAIDASSQ
jgi:two-component system cell cycle sensor histidine kinase/response regulator CckA